MADEVSKHDGRGHLTLIGISEDNEEIRIVRVKDDGTLATSPAAPAQGYKSYEGNVSTGSPVILNVNTDLTRNGLYGHIINNDGNGADITMKFNDSENDGVTLSPGEVFSLESMNCSSIILSTTGSSIAYRVMVK